MQCFQINVLYVGKDYYVLMYWILWKQALNSSGLKHFQKIKIKKPRNNFDLQKNFRTTEKFRRSKMKQKKQRNNFDLFVKGQFRFSENFYKNFDLLLEIISNIFNLLFWSFKFDLLTFNSSIVLSFLFWIFYILLFCLKIYSK
jgi:hypothetical protein